ncbi:MAG: hypothetical protein U5K37_08115 [Natrialbaceae archaeon]|nr:hypothetical protein [Natrialbaceae archaeon]
MLVVKIQGLSLRADRHRPDPTEVALEVSHVGGDAAVDDLEFVEAHPP